VASGARSRLETAIREATVAIEAAGDRLGSGFFAAPDLVLTCAHVLAGDRDDVPDRVTATWRGEQVQLVTIKPTWNPGHDGGADLALLRSPRRCELFLRFAPHVEPGDELWSYGYPAGLYRGGDSVSFRYEGSSVRIDGAILMRVTQGNARPGFSGAPVVDWATGGVCGVLRLGDQPAAGSSGGRLVPANIVKDTYPELDTGDDDGSWAQLLDDEQLRAGAWRYPGTEIRKYLTAARTTARRHPYQVGLPSAPDLTAVYLRQHVTAHAEAGRSASSRLGTADADAGPAELTQVFQKMDIQELLRRDHSGALIIGGPGSGKSSMLRDVLERAATSWLSLAPQDFVPILIPARALAEPLEFAASIAQGLRQELGSRLDTSGLDALLENEPMPGVPWLVLLDGVDEVVDARNRAQIFEAVEQRLGDSRYRFLLTTRMLERGEMDALRNKGLLSFEIQPFDSGQLRVLAERWFTALDLPDVPELVDRFSRQIVDSRVTQLARYPLIATIICIIFAKNPGQELPRSRVEIYDEFIRLLLGKPFSQVLAGEHLKELTRPYGNRAQQAVEELLGELKQTMEAVADERMSGAEGSLLALAEKHTTKYQKTGLVPASEWREIVREMLRQSGLVSETTDGDFVFNHQTIMEYLAACYIAAGARMDVRQRWRYVTLAAWNESFALFVVAKLLQKHVDFTRRVPRLLAIRRLIHARLVAALIHDGCDLRPELRRIAVVRLSRIAENKVQCLPPVMRRGRWLFEDDCVMAAKSLALVDRERGLDLLVRLAVDPAVGGLDIADLFTEGRLDAEFIEVDPERGLALLTEIVSAPGEDNFTRAQLADFVLEKDQARGISVMERLAKDDSMDELSRVQCIRKLLGMNRARGVEASGFLIADYRVGTDIRVAEYSFLSAFDRQRAIAALKRMATEAHNSDLTRAVASIVLCRDEADEGVMALAELSRDRQVSGFHRVYHFSFPWVRADLANKMAELSADATLPVKWRTFAAEQLWESDARRGVEALRALRGSAPGGWLAHLNVALKAYIFRAGAARRIR
jgi:Trypsin-like peptidase domain